MNETTTETELDDTPNRLYGRESVLGLTEGEALRRIFSIARKALDKIKTAPCVTNTESGTPSRKVIQNHEHSEYSTV